MSKFAHIRSLPTENLKQFRIGLLNDIKARRAHGREYTSLMRYLGVATLELQIRQRRERLQAELNDLSGYDYDWKKRADLR